MKNRIYELRKARGLSQEQLGKAVGTSGQQIDRLEDGERKLTMVWMERLSRPLDVHPLELLSAEDARRYQAEPSAPSEFIEDPDKLALLRFWDDMSKGQKTMVLRIIEAISRPIDDEGEPPEATV